MIKTFAPKEMTVQWGGRHVNRLPQHIIIDVINGENPECGGCKKRGSELS